MDILNSCDIERSVIFVVWDGEVNWEEWRGLIPRLLADPAWTSISRLIADVQTVTDTSSLGDREMGEVAAIFGSNLSAVAKKHVAVIAREEFSKVKHFGDLISSIGTSMVVFNNLDTACLYLGIDLMETRQRLDELRAALRGSK